MKIIKLPEKNEDIIKLRIRISTLCTYISRYISVKERVFRGNSEHNDQPDYIVGTVDELDNKSGNFNLKLTNADKLTRAYAVKLHWLHFNNETIVKEIFSDSFSGDLETGESKDISETYVFEK